MDLTNLSIKTLRTSLDKREISATELTKEYIKAIKAENEKCNAFITITEDEALENASSAQQMLDGSSGSKNISLLTGIPYSLKDNICTKNIKTTCASKMLEDFVPFYNADIFETLKQNGCILLGKTNMDEFAMGNSSRTSAFGPVPNPYDGELVSGGSSSGSAVSVAKNLSLFSVGTDTGGSVRQPASHCGVVGLKPTFETFKRNGVVEFSGSLDTVGLIAKTAEDCAYILDTLTKKTRSLDDIDKGVKGLKIAIPRELFSSDNDIESEVRTSIEKTIESLKQQGAEITEISIPILEFSASAYFIISTAEAVSALSRYDGLKYGLKGKGATFDEQFYDSRTRGFGDEVKRRLMLGNFALSGDNLNDYFKKAVLIKKQMKSDLDGVFNKFDAIISPTSSRRAFKLCDKTENAKIYASTLYTTPANLAGLPSVSVPANQSVAFSGENLPVGISVMGKAFDEAMVLRIANSIQNAKSG